MDSSRFDEFTKILVNGTSRRQALKTIAATVVGGVFGLSRAGEALASHCRHLGHTCEHNTECCSGFCHDGRCRCLPDQQRCDQQCCSPGSFCFEGECIFCPEGSRICNDHCCPPDSFCTEFGCAFCPSHRFCNGRCCPIDSFCFDGQCFQHHEGCFPPCPDGFFCHNGTCFPPPEGCFPPCPVGFFCHKGNCQPLGTSPSQNMDPSFGQPPNSQPNQGGSPDAGGCGNCQPGTTCINGHCVHI